MKVIGFTHRSSGCGFHRVVLPLGFMDGVRAVITDASSPDQLQHVLVSEQWDVLLYNRISIFDNQWAETKKTLGVKVILDLDDDWILPPSHINYRQYKAMQPRIESNIAQADLVTCTNELIAARVRPVNQNVIVIPNALPYGEHQFIENRVEAEAVNGIKPVRIFWAGGASHEKDLAILRNPMKKIAGLNTKSSPIEMVLGGYTDRDPASKIVWDKMASFFTAGGKLPYQKLPGCLPEKYMWMYAYADIMVVPLESSPWHAAKSNLKLLEAASKRIPVVCSKVEPYSRDADAPVLWVESQKNWFNHVNYLIKNPSAREEMGNKLYEWAKEKYDLRKVNEGRRAAFESLVGAPALL